MQFNAGCVTIYLDAGNFTLSFISLGVHWIICPQPINYYHNQKIQNCSTLTLARNQAMTVQKKKKKKNAKQSNWVKLPSEQISAGQF